MEGGEPQHLNEAGPPETDGDEVAASTGGGRFYECVFCKRGFTTAQALGGHMNIHRRDRTKIRPARLSPPGPRRGEEAYHPYSREQRHIQPQVVESSSSNYVVYFASPSPSPVGSREKSELVLAGEELQLGLAGAGETKGKQREAGTEGLDLELRLGRSRSHDSSDS